MIDSIIGVLRATKRRAMQRPEFAWLPWMKRRIMRRREGEEHLLERFALIHGYPLDIANPQTFTEKMFTRMVRWNRYVDPSLTRLVDKLEVREHVSRVIGEQFLVPLLWQGKDPRRIPFDRLPASYVIKTNHGSGYILVVKGDADRGEIVRRASGWLSSNLYWVAREYQYYHIPPRIVIEEYLENPDASAILVYRFWCFDGVPRLLSVSNLARTVGGFYDTSWNRIDVTPHIGRPAKLESAKPDRFEEMVPIAARLSRGFDFVRVDLFNVDGRIYFNELTFTPGAGEFRFDPPEWDLRLGQMWTMSDAFPRPAVSETRVPGASALPHRAS